MLPPICKYIFGPIRLESRLKPLGMALVLLSVSMVSSMASESQSAPMDAKQDASGLDHLHPDIKYVCPMHPHIVRDGPGSCPICGMKLVKKAMPLPQAASPSPAAPVRPEVSVSPALLQALGVRTEPVVRQALSKDIRTVGRVAYDETRLVHVHARADGWIESLKVRSEGAPVKKGQELADFYSPRILNAQVDFLLALKPKVGDPADRKADKTRNLLRLLDVPEDAIIEIERTRTTRNSVPVRAPMDGILVGLTAREGMYVNESLEMFTIADIDKVWVVADVFEAQLDWLAPGLSAEIRVPARPGRTWEGRVDYVYPELDPKTRTVKVRMAFPNPDATLKPNMFADVTIHGGAKRDLLTIPVEALIQTGERETVVKSLGDGRFAPVDVKSGMRQRDRIEILDGLSEGDRVVVSGQFLIDSESSLRASFRRMGEGDSGAAPEQPHLH